jgi:hypothetical protein
MPGGGEKIYLRYSIITYAHTETLFTYISSLLYVAYFAQGTTQSARSTCEYDGICTSAAIFLSIHQTMIDSCPNYCHLKEETPVDITTLAPTQLLLYILLTLLVGWMFTFVCLAIRRTTEPSFETQAITPSLQAVSAKSMAAIQHALPTPQVHTDRLQYEPEQQVVLEQSRR